MASRKRARTSSTGGSSSSSAAAPTISLSGGEACPTKQVSLWRSGRLTDTTVEVDGRTFVAHRLVLAAACGYFERHYDHEHMRDADHPKLLEHVTAAAFEPLLSFLYEGACTFDESLLAPVLRAAHYLGVAPLERAAVGALTERLSPSNALTAWTWGEELELPELAEAAKEAALQNFDEVEKIEEATLAQVQALVADDRLDAKSEEVVFSAVVRFAEAKQPAEAELFGLLRNVRFAQMNRAFLHGTVRPWPQLQSSAGAHLLLEMVAPVASGPAQQPRSGFGGRLMYMIGGSTTNSGDTHISTTEIYDTKTNTWAAGTPMPTTRQNTAAAVLGGKIFVLGGYPSTASVVALDTRMGTWAAVAPMARARMALVAAASGGKLYAIGGSSHGGEPLSSVEAFDPLTGAWAEVASLPIPRVHAGAAVLEGKIYVIGGRESTTAQSVLGSVEVYDPTTTTWAAVTPLGTRRSGHAVAALSGKIYVAGGRTTRIDGTSQRLSSVEVFDPQTNTWANVAPMSTARSAVSLSAVGGKLYAVGGLPAMESQTMATAETYDPQQDRWEVVASMAQARRSAVAVCVPRA